MSVKTPMFIFLFAAYTAAAQQAPEARAAYQQQLAVREVERLAQQFDQLAANVDQIANRMVKLESGDSSDDLRAEISGIKAQIAELKREQEAMRREIVAEISRKMAGLLAQRQPPPAHAAPSAGRASSSRESPPRAKPAPKQPAVSGNYYEHIVEPGQTLSLIARGYDTTIGKILSANPGLKPNLLRPGQKIIVPEETKK